MTRCRADKCTDHQPVNVQLASFISFSTLFPSNWILSLSVTSGSSPKHLFLESQHLILSPVVCRQHSPSVCKLIWGYSAVDSPGRSHSLTMDWSLPCGSPKGNQVRVLQWLCSGYWGFPVLLSVCVYESVVTQPNRIHVRNTSAIV